MPTRWTSGKENITLSFVHILVTGPTALTLLPQEEERVELWVESQERTEPEKTEARVRTGYQVEGTTDAVVPAEVVMERHLVPLVVVPSLSPQCCVLVEHWYSVIVKGRKSDSIALSVIK